MSTLNFLGVAHSEIGRAILKKGEITLYSQKTESRTFKVSSMDLFLKTKGLTHFFKVIWYAKSENQCFKLRNGVLLSLFACFQDGRQSQTESYIVVDSLFNVPMNIFGGSVLVFVLLCIYLCSIYFC